jgi:hypothetical protein
MYYEVTLSDCDGQDATAHVEDDGTITPVRNGSNEPPASLAKFRRLLWTLNVDDTPKWVLDILKKRYPVAMRRVTSHD